ncbi:serine/threonine protein kinase [Calothrix sp. NIES-4071]|nr:serine/threonine protein kinase [Calothrix sp. NIES-4071]BAZ59090.1 serine/threonine protein kinase [Calothrix sp. NIES-4105]
MLLNNRYRVIQTLGSGGFGETFLAEDTQMPSNRRCVIKQLKPINNNPEIYQLVKERFQREAAILEELGDNSNQIPRLYAYFSENGQFYLVQEYIQGQTLNAKVQSKGVMSENAVRDILISLLPVLDYVHGRGIVHRDIKPDNIIIRQSDGKPVLIDFGAVKETIGTVVTPSGNSTRSIVIGTPGFMPSEQSVGRPMFASDIYSLGMTAIFLLTGKLPQEIPNDPATGVLLWRSLATSLTPGFAMVLDKAIQFVPQHRFNSARDMLFALQSGSASIPTIPYSQTPTYNPPTNQPTNPPTNQPTNQLTNQSQQNTVPISPVNQPYQQASNSGNTPPIGQNNARQIPRSNTRGVVVGAIIGAGLISGAVVLASMLNNQGQVEDTVPTPVATSNVPRSTPSPTQDYSEPPVISTPRNRATRRSIPTREPEPEPTITATDTPTDIPTNIPKNIPTDIPTDTPTTIETKQPLPSPSETQTPETPNTKVPDVIVPTVIPTQRPPRPTTESSPAEFVENYYNGINNKNLKKTWNKLTPELRSNRKLHPRGFDSYTGWWDGQVEQVEVDQINLVKQNDYSAIVDAQLNYLLRNGKQSPARVRFTLVWDATSSQWLINDAR